MLKKCQCCALSDSLAHIVQRGKLCRDCAIKLGLEYRRQKASRTAPKQRSRHLGVAEDSWPFSERQVDGDDDRGLFIEAVEAVLLASGGEAAPPLVRYQHRWQELLKEGFGHSPKQGLTKLRMAIGTRHDKVCFLQGA